MPRTRCTALLVTALTLTIVPVALEAATHDWPATFPCDTTLDACLASVPDGAIVQVATDELVTESVRVERGITLTAAPGYRPTLAEVTIAKQGGELRGLTIQGTVWIHTGDQMRRAVVAGNAIFRETPDWPAAIYAIDTSTDRQPRLDLQIVDNVIESAGDGIFLCELGYLGGEIDFTISRNRMHAEGAALCVSTGDRRVDFKLALNRFDAGWGSWIVFATPARTRPGAQLTAKVTGNDLRAAHDSAFGVSSPEPDAPILLSVVGNELHDSIAGLALFDPSSAWVSGVVAQNRFIRNSWVAWYLDGAAGVSFVDNVEIDNGP
jgi:hypothetical protein